MKASAPEPARPGEAPAAGFRSGLVAIVGRPNVGKSTLLNALVGHKLAIVSRKAQTTRQPLTGVLTRPDAQFALVDTPGFRQRRASALDRVMNRYVERTLAGVDAAIFVVEALRFEAQDEAVLRLLPAGLPVVLAVSKTDRVATRERLLPFIARVAARFPFAAVVPLSAQKGFQLDALLEEVRRCLPEGPHVYDPAMLTDRSERFLAAELVREKIFRLLGEEVPYAATVTIERFEHQGALRRIHATVMVDKPGQKAILIGSGGATMKRIATEARLDMASLFGGRVYLEVFVKVRRGWADDEAALRSLGFEA